ncbi:Ribosomal protein L4 domain superfamily [Arabidopsis thaliana x Arabidopsis arenosa]|uniref:Ribosomal protein L4 domain superfamily n=1 Tax=Arabidopsis thaliana x Arabidopsis arenosa TaxID=1240361 RepID=A0A8T2C4G1_9BRAS|nr:Ribosomal protein L4 domain superfamily [Arabidopsis thaliana x Arabidopsis arenosa]
MAAKSLGAGRSVSPIPLIPGGGTYRAGQASFGYMCLGNRMFSLGKMWRRWHRQAKASMKRNAAVAAARPLISVQSVLYAYGNITAIPLPAVLMAPVRPDVVNYVHAQVSNNSRQPYAVSKLAGHQTSAKYWRTGLAISRIPRVSCGGTYRAGQAAYGNMCRGEFPLVVSDSIESVEETSEAIKVLKRIGDFADAEKAKDSVGVRYGKGKMRNRRYISRKGPLIVYGTKGSLVEAFRNIPGIDICNVERLNLLKLAPGGHLGRPGAMPFSR